MINDEIIKGLNAVKEECGKHLDEGFAWICQPIDAAIEILKAGSCEDAISRQAVLEKLPRRTMKNYFGEVVGDVVYIDDIKALPPVTPQPKMGVCKWIKYDYRTICPKEHDTDSPYWRIPKNRKEVLKYCPYCGLEIVIDGECESNGSN